MIAPLDFSRLENALSNPRYWVELALVLACLLLAWVIDRRIETAARKRHAGAPHETRLHANLSAGVGRIVFSLVGLLLLAMVRPVFAQMSGHKPFFIDIAIPLLVALALIRMLVFMMRRFFANSDWLKTSERAISFSIWLLAILYFVGVLPEVARELDELRLPLGKDSVSLLTILKGAAVVLVTIVVSLWISSLIEQRLAAATSLDSNLRAVLDRVVRAVILVVGVLIALQSIGFDLTLLTVFGGALGVGVGLGLQRLAANYISGFTILLDKSIKLGDMITVDGRQGRVAAVTSRYVLLRAVDGVEVIVPNETLVTTTVLNHTPNSYNARISVILRVAQGADVNRAMDIMMQSASKEPRALVDKDPPIAFMNGVTDQGVELELQFWISGGNTGMQGIRSEVQRRILADFRDKGIAFAPPRQELRLSAAAPDGAPAPAPAAPAPAGEP